MAPIDPVFTHLLEAIEAEMPRVSAERKSVLLEIEREIRIPTDQSLKKSLASCFDDPLFFYAALRLRRIKTNSFNRKSQTFTALASFEERDA